MAPRRSPIRRHATLTALLLGLLAGTVAAAEPQAPTEGCHDVVADSEARLDCVLERNDLLHRQLDVWTLRAIELPYGPARYETARTSAEEREIFQQSVRAAADLGTFRDGLAQTCPMPPLAQSPDIAVLANVFDCRNDAMWQHIASLEERYRGVDMSSFGELEPTRSSDSSFFEIQAEIAMWMADCPEVAPGVVPALVRTDAYFKRLKALPMARGLREILAEDPMATEESVRRLVIDEARQQFNEAYPSSAEKAAACSEYSAGLATFLRDFGR